MPNEIPDKPRKPDFRTKFFLTQDIGLAAALLADTRVPRISVREIASYQEGDQRFCTFRFPPCDDVRRVFEEWKRCVEDAPETERTQVAYIWRAFEYHNRFVNLIRRRLAAQKPTQLPAGHAWTTNTKIAATAMAFRAGPMVPEGKLRAMIFRDGADRYGYIMAEGPIVSAFANPEKQIELHPEDALSYVVAAFYHRDHLRDLVKKMPARHIFRDGQDVHFVNEPKPAKEIPCPSKP